MIFTRLLDARRYYVGWLKHTYAANDDITRWLFEIYRDTEISRGIIAVRAYSKWPVVYDRGDAIRTFSFVRRAKNGLAPLEKRTINFDQRPAPGTRA